MTVARTDMVVRLIKAANEGDSRLLRQTVEQIAAEERSKQHHIAADRLLAAMDVNHKRKLPATSTLSLSNELDLYLRVSNPEIRFSDMVISRSNRESLENLVIEQSRGGLLRSYGLEPRNRVILVGPPGNGKTSIAEAIAESMAVPFMSVKYEGLIDSLLGETASRLEKVFDYVRSRACVLFFDEIDVLAKERGDAFETGEIKRVVSSLLLQIDRLPSHCVVVTATNHAELLDRAVWRRFQLRLSIDPPDAKGLAEWQELFEHRWEVDLPLPGTLRNKVFAGRSYSDLEEFGLEVLRRSVLAEGILRPSVDIVKSVVDELKDQFSLGIEG